MPKRAWVNAAPSRTTYSMPHQDPAVARWRYAFERRRRAKIVLLPPVSKRAPVHLRVGPSIGDHDEQLALLVEPPHLGVFGVWTRVPGGSRVVLRVDVEPIAVPLHRNATPWT